MNTDGSGEQPIEGMPPRIDGNDAWHADGSGIYFLTIADYKDVTSRLEIDFFDLNTRKVRTVHVPDGKGWTYMGGLSVSPDGKWLLFAQLDERSSDLMMVENWH